MGRCTWHISGAGALAAVPALALAGLLAPVALAQPAATAVYLGEGHMSWVGALARSGEAELPVFSASYLNVESSDGSNVVAPGVSGGCSVAVRNESTSQVSWSAALDASDADRLPLSFTFTQVGAPADDEAAGVLEPGEEAEVQISWEWPFGADDEADAVDTALGNAAAAGEDVSLSVALQVTFEDEGTPTSGDVLIGDDGGDAPNANGSADGDGDGNDNNNDDTNNSDDSATGQNAPDGATGGNGADDGTSPAAGTDPNAAGTPLARTADASFSGTGPLAALGSLCALAGGALCARLSRKLARRR
jgi:hypothetical protein